MPSSGHRGNVCLFKRVRRIAQRMKNVLQESDSDKQPDRKQTVDKLYVKIGPNKEQDGEPVEQFDPRSAVSLKENG